MKQFFINFINLNSIINKNYDSNLLITISILIRLKTLFLKKNLQLLKHKKIIYKNIKIKIQISFSNLNNKKNKIYLIMLEQIKNYKST